MLPDNIKAVKLCKHINTCGWCSVRDDVCIKLITMYDKDLKPVAAPDCELAAEEKLVGEAVQKYREMILEASKSMPVHGQHYGKDCGMLVFDELAADEKEG